MDEREGDRTGRPLLAVVFGGVGMALGAAAAILLSRQIPNSYGAGAGSPVTRVQSPGTSSAGGPPIVSEAPLPYGSASGQPGPTARGAASAPASAVTVDGRPP
jgi:hypothetical protein